MMHSHERLSLPERTGGGIRSLEHVRNHLADIRHDPWLIPASPGLKTLAEDVFSHLESLSASPSHQRKDATERRRETVHNLVANLALLVLFHPEGTRLAISAKNTPLTRYDRPAFPREVVIRSAKGLEQLGFVSLSIGVRRVVRTTIQPSPSFRAALLANTNSRPLARLSGAEPIILKASTGRHQPKQPIGYKDTGETVLMREEMKKINSLLSMTDIRFAGKPTPPVFLTRRFQIASPDAAHTFDKLGRLYGGLWEAQPKAKRHLLTIDGEPLADLDFRAMYVQLAYLREGLPLPKGDPYDWGIGLPRNVVKLVLVTLLNKSRDTDKLPESIIRHLPPAWSASRVVTAIKKRHQGIAHLFGSAVGLSLMFTESQILVRLLLLLADKGVPALPMHDGIMVAKSNVIAAQKAMTQASEEVLGSRLPIIEKPILRPDNDNSPCMI